jgi:hypothetical protein
LLQLKKGEPEFLVPLFKGGRGISGFADTPEKGFQALKTQPVIDKNFPNQWLQANDQKAKLL